MKAGFHKAVGLAVALALWAHNASDADAAKPADKGGGSNNTTEAVAGTVPEIYRAEFDYFNRIFTLSGVGLITGDGATPVFPTDVTIGGQPITIDPTSATAMTSVSETDFSTFEGPLIIPFEDILTALEGPRVFPKRHQGRAGGYRFMPMYLLNLFDGAKRCGARHYFLQRRRRHPNRPIHRSGLRKDRRNRKRKRGDRGLAQLGIA
ncbi:MAG: hypothetical protein P8Z76_19795 [Alphaproteobacteria bacterium]